uniref:Craniofacial development protein 2 n=1 Tax=Cacopsylla melanoneura TaxID=428564 RepID=A0A8D8Z2U9_9HEMI
MTRNPNTMAVSPGHLLNEATVRRIPPLVNERSVNNVDHVDDVDNVNIVDKVQRNGIVRSKEKLKVMNHKKRIATWNVRSLNQDGKLQNVNAERKRMNIDILGLCEVRWTGSGCTRMEDADLYYSGLDVYHYAGVGVMIDKSIRDCVLEFVPLSERAMLLRLQTNYRPMNIIQVYAPTADKDDDVIELLYDQVETLLKLTKKGEITIISGDWNAKVGCGEHARVVGKFGLGDRNDRGDRLIQFCCENNLFMSNTFFQLPARRLYTWTSPSGEYRNQIDFILVPQSFRKDLKSACAYPGADVNSDHNPVVITLKMGFRKTKKNPPTRRIDVRKLIDPVIRENVKTEMCNALEIFQDQDTLDLVWESWKKTQHSIQKNTIGYITRAYRLDDGRNSQANG